MLAYGAPRFVVFIICSHDYGYLPTDAMEHHPWPRHRELLATRTLSWPAGRACAAAFSVAPLDHVALATRSAVLTAWRPFLGRVCGFSAAIILIKS
jgi:hypothetical protein